MLFPYTYVPHQIEKMQEFIDFIFYDVWSRAPGAGIFRFDLFNGSPELKEVMKAFYYGHTKYGDFFYGLVERIYKLFAVLQPQEIAQYRRWYQANNNIESACANNPAVQVARYIDLVVSHAELTLELERFFKGLYDRSLLESSVLKGKIGEIKSHNKAFFTVNNLGKCPFCGINDLKGIHHAYREAYDHFLPQSRYPFNSINFRNLAPACHECNSVYKLSKDPIYGAACRRKSFYPYADVAHTIEISVNVDTPNIEKLTPNCIHLTFGPAIISEEIETWKDVYGIEERYKAKCSSENDGKYWVTQILDEWENDGRSPSDYLKTLGRLAEKYPVADSNFLKKAFLVGCQRAGLFNGLAEE